MREIDELLDLCRYAGSSVEIGQGAGGNASVKTPDGVMWIKASGYRLSAVREGHGYLPMRTPEAASLSQSIAGMDALAANLSMSAYLQSLVLDSTNLRPSLETWFHVVLGRVVLHTHPIYANAFACMEGGREELECLLSERPAYVEYHSPGHLLGEAVHRTALGYYRDRGTRPAQLLLENHGLIATAETGREAIARSQEVLEAGRRFFGPLDEDTFCPAKPAELDAWADDLQGACAAYGMDRAVRAARFQRLRGKQTRCAFLPEPLVPDDVICNGLAIIEVHRFVPAQAFFARHRATLMQPAAILVRDIGFVFLAPARAMTDAMEEQLLANVLVRELVARRGVCRPLPQREISALLAMESEKHRRTVLASGGVECR